MNWAGGFYRNTHLLGMCILVLLVGGLSSLLNLPRTEDPRITNRNPLIVTAFPGASAKRVEALVTDKLEESLREVAEIKTTESTSRPGISLVAVELIATVADSQKVFAKIRDKMEEAALLFPAGAGQPFLDDNRGATTYTRIISLTWPGEGQPMLGVMDRLAEELAERLRNLPGSELVRTFGDVREEVAIELDRERLANLRMTANEVAGALARADSKVPAGVIRGENQDLFLEVAGELDSVKRIAAIPLRRGPDGRILRLGDIAKIEKAYRDPPDEMAFVNGSRAMMVAARVDPGVRADRWARSADQVMQGFQAEFGGNLQAELIFDQTRYTAERLGELSKNLILGAMVVVLVILFMMGWRSALLIGSALPLTMAGVLFMFSVLEVPLHQMSIFGLILAMGLLIDNAIVMVDEVTKERRAGHTSVEAVKRAVGHLFIPLLGSTLTTILSFCPILLLPGNIGDFIGTISVSVILSLIFSFGLSMTVIPALTARFGSKPGSGQRQGWFRHGVRSQRLRTRLSAILLLLIKRPLLGLAVAVFFPVLGFMAASQLKQQFFPPADRDQFQLEMWLDSDASLHATSELAAAIDQLIAEDPDIRERFWLVGGSMPSVYYNLIMNKDGTSSYAQAIFRVHEVSTIKSLLPRLQQTLDESFPSAQIVLSQLGQGPPIESPIAVRVSGPGLTELRHIGEQLRMYLAHVPKVLHTRASMEAGETKVLVDLDEHEGYRAGTRPVDLARQLQASLEGVLAGSVLEEDQELPVRIRTLAEQRDHPLDLASASLVVEPSSPSLPLTALASVTLEPEINAITRRNGVRTMTIEGYLELGALPMEVTKAFLANLEEANWSLPSGYSMAIGGDAEEQRAAIGSLLLYLPVLLLLMVTTIVLSFRSLTLAAVLGGVALLSVGLGILSVYLAGYPFGFNPTLGIAGLIGIALNDSIVVLAAIRANPQAAQGNPDAMVREVLGCSRHVVSTTLTTIGGFLPLLLFTGGDFWPPLAVVIAGGVGGATLLALVFIPAAYRLTLPMHRPKQQVPAGSGWSSLAEVNP